MDVNQIKINIGRELSKEIKDLKQKKKLIENLEIKPVTIDEWQELCRTSLRYDDLLIEIAKATFPQGTNFCRGCNEVSFNLNGINISLPTSISQVIIVNMSWYIGFTGDYPKFSYKYPNMKRYFELLDSGEYSWYDLAKCRNPYEKSKTSLFIWWFTRGVWHKVDRNKWMEAFKKDEESYKVLVERRDMRKKEVEDKINILKGIIPILTEFSEVKGYYNGKYHSSEELMKLELK